MIFKSDFRADWYNMLKQELLSEGFNIQEEGVTDGNIAHVYFNSKQRIINTAKRTVEVSDVFICPSELISGWNVLKSKIENGQDITLHHSMLIRNAAAQDLMLSDWGVYHFHLGTTLNEHGFFQRTKPLLFAKVTSDTFYAINIYNHGAWNDTTIIETIHRNWPHLISSSITAGIKIFAQDDQKKAAIRKQHGNSFLTTKDGTVYAPVGGGIMTSGYSASNAIKVVQMHNLLSKLTNILDEEKEKYTEMLKKVGYVNENEVEAKLRIVPGYYIVFFPKYEFEILFSMPS